MGERRRGESGEPGTGCPAEAEDAVLRRAVAVLQSSYLHSSSRQGFQYSRASLVENELFLSELEAFARAKRAAGYSPEELQETFAFLLFDKEEEAKEVCQTGLRVNSSSISSLGDPAKGVYISKHADCLQPRPWPHGKSGYIVICKLIKGKVRVIAEDSTAATTCPSPGYDCHVSQHSQSQYYVYEVSGGSAAERPRQVCPYIALACHYRDPGDSPARSPAERRHRAVSWFCPWRGQLSIRGRRLCSIALRTPHSPTIPAQLPSNLDINHVMGLSDLRKKIPEAAFGKKNYTENEVCFQGVYSSLYEVEISNKDQHKMDQLVEKLKEKDLAIIKYLQDQGVLILLTSSALAREDGLEPKEPVSLLALFLFTSPRALGPRVDQQDPKDGRQSSAVSLKIASVLPGIRYALRKAAGSSRNSTGPAGIERHLREFAKLRENPQPTPGRNSDVPIPPLQDEGPQKLPERSLSHLRRYLCDPGSYSLGISVALECLRGSDPGNSCPERGGEGPPEDVSTPSKAWGQQSRRKSSRILLARRNLSPLEASGEDGRGKEPAKKKISVAFSFPKKSGSAGSSSEPMLKLANLQFPHGRKRGAEVLAAEIVHKSQSEAAAKEPSAPDGATSEAKRPKTLENAEMKKAPGAESGARAGRSRTLRSLENRAPKPPASDQERSERQEPLPALPSAVPSQSHGAEIQRNDINGIYPSAAPGGGFALRGDNSESHALNLLADLALGSCVPAFVPRDCGATPVSHSLSLDPSDCGATPVSHSPPLVPSDCGVTAVSHSPPLVPRDCGATPVSHSPPFVPRDCGVTAVSHSPPLIPSDCGVTPVSHSPPLIPRDCGVTAVSHSPPLIPRDCGVTTVSRSPPRDPREQRSPSEHKSPRTASDHKYHRADRHGRKAAPTGRACQSLELPEKTDSGSVASPPREKTPGISIEDSVSPSPAPLPPREAPEAAEVNRHSIISAEHSYASPLPENPRKHPNPRGNPNSGPAPSRNGTRSAPAVPLVGKVLPFRHQHNALEPSPCGGSARKKEDFAKTHTVNICGNSMKVTCRWEEEYLFSLDSRYTKDSLEKTVIRALHGPWDPNLPDDVEGMKLIFHMWVALFYRKPSKLLSSSRMVVEHSNPRKYVSINSTSGFLELSDDSQDCFGFETCAADSGSDPDQTPSSSLDPSAPSQGASHPEKSPADSQTDADGTAGAVDSTVSSSSGELPCGEEEEEPSSTSCPESLSLAGRAQEGLDGADEEPEVDPEEGTRDISSVTTEEPLQEDLLDATSTPSPSEELPSKPLVAETENACSQAPNSSSAPRPDPPCELQEHRGQQESRWAAGSGSGPGPPEDGQGVGDAGHCPESEDTADPRPACDSVPSEASPQRTEPGGAPEQGEEPREPSEHSEKDERETEEGKEENKDFEDENVGAVDLVLSESSDTEMECEHGEQNPGNSASPEELGVPEEDPVPSPTSLASPCPDRSTPALSDGPGTDPRALPGEMSPSREELPEPWDAPATPGSETDGIGVASPAAVGSPCSDSGELSLPPDPSPEHGAQPDSVTDSSGPAGDTLGSSPEQEDRDQPSAERWEPAGGTASPESPRGHGLALALSPDSSSVCLTSPDGSVDPWAAPEDQPMESLQSPSQSDLGRSSCFPQACGDDGADLNSLQACGDDDADLNSSQACGDDGADLNSPQACGDDGADLNSFQACGDDGADLNSSQACGDDDADLNSSQACGDDDADLNSSQACGDDGADLNSSQACGDDGADLNSPDTEESNQGGNSVLGEEQDGDPSANGAEVLDDPTGVAHGQDSPFDYADLGDDPRAEERDDEFPGAENSPGHDTTDTEMAADTPQEPEIPPHHRLLESEPSSSAMEGISAVQELPRPQQSFPGIPGDSAPASPAGGSDPPSPAVPSRRESVLCCLWKPRWEGGAAPVSVAAWSPDGSPNPSPSQEEIPAVPAWSLDGSPDPSCSQEEIPAVAPCSPDGSPNPSRSQEEILAAAPWSPDGSPNPSHSQEGIPAVPAWSPDGSPNPRRSQEGIPAVPAWSPDGSPDPCHSQEMIPAVPAWSPAGSPNPSRSQEEIPAVAPCSPDGSPNPSCSQEVIPAAIFWSPDGSPNPSRSQEVMPASVPCSPDGSPNPSRSQEGIPDSVPCSPAGSPNPSRSQEEIPAVAPWSPDGSPNPSQSQEEIPAPCSPADEFVPGEPESAPPSPYDPWDDLEGTEPGSPLPGALPATPDSARWSGSCARSPEQESLPPEDVQGGSGVPSPAPFPEGECHLWEPWEVCEHSAEGSEAFPDPDCAGSEEGEAEIPASPIAVSPAHRDLCGDSLELSDAEEIPDGLPREEQLPSPDRHEGSAFEDPLENSFGDSDREFFEGNSQSPPAGRSSCIMSSMDAAEARTTWGSSRRSPVPVGEDWDRGVPRGFVVTRRCQDRTESVHVRRHSRRAQEPPLLRSLLRTWRGVEEITQNTLDMECLRFHYKLKQILRNGRPAFSTSRSIFPKEFSPRAVSPLPPSPRSRSPLQVTVSPSDTRPGGLRSQRHRDGPWDTRRAGSRGHRDCWDPRDRRDHRDRQDRCAPLHLGKLRYERSPPDSRGDVAVILDEYSEFQRVVLGRAGAGGEALARGEAGNERTAPARPDRTAAFPGMIAELCGALRSQLRRVALGQPGMFYLLETGTEPFFDRAKALLKEEGLVRVEPLSFCGAKRQDSERLLVIVRNEDIASHIHSVPCLLELKRCPGVVFAGVDDPEDVTGDTFQELFQAGGFVVSDKELLERVTLGRLKELVKALEKLNRSGRWKWLLHYSESKKLRGDLRDDAQKKRLLLKWCQGEDLLELLPFHSCDGAGAAEPWPTQCLLQLQAQRIGARFAVYLTENPDSSRESLESKGILVADINTFLGTLQEVAAPFRRSYW